MKDGNTAPAAQAQARAHPNVFDKWLWLEPIMARRDISKGAKVLAQRLAHHHNSKTGLCNPSMPTLATGTGSSRAAVARDLAILREAGIIDWVQGNGTGVSNRYTLKDVAISQTKADLAAQGGKGPALRLATSDGVPVPEVGPVQASEPVPEVGPYPSQKWDYPPVPEVGPEPMQSSNPVKETTSPLDPSSASDGPATPFSPSTGHQGAQDSTHTSQPAAKVERQSKPREIPWPDTLVWSKEVHDMARDHYAGPVGGKSKDVFIAFKVHALKNGWRRTDWHKAWRDWYREAGRIENAKRLKGRNAGI